MKKETYIINTNRGKKGDYELVLEGDLSIKNILSIKNALPDTEIRKCNVTLKLRNIEKLDLTTIQVLDAYKRKLNDNGCETVVSAILPEEIQGLITKSGLSIIFK